MSSKILVALRIAAPPEVVFDAFTDDIALWWRPNSLFAFTPRSPGVMAFEDGRLVERVTNLVEALQRVRHRPRRDQIVVHRQSGNARDGPAIWPMCA